MIFKQSFTFNLKTEYITNCNNSDSLINFNWKVTNNTLMEIWRLVDIQVELDKFFIQMLCI